MTWKRWITSFLNAGVSGLIISGAGIAMNLTPVQIAKLAAAAFIGSAGKWYLQHPPPGVEETVKEKESLVTDLGDGHTKVFSVEKTTTTPAAN